jgi:predicted extracellular nuclease
LPATLISEVQGDGLASPLVGTQVVIEGIVVGDFQNNASADHGDLGGFFVQEEDADADGDPLTSEGVFVSGGGFGVDVAEGERVRINGVVAESYGLTQIGGLSDVLICDTGNTVTPADVTLPVGSVDDLEAFEGMSMLIEQPLYISEYYNFDRFGEIVLTTERQFQPTAIYDPGSTEGDQLAEENTLGRIQLDDGTNEENPDPARHPNGMEFTLDNRFRGGDIVENVTGVLGYAFSAYEIQPTAGADYTAVNERPAVPSVGGDITVASFNVLNYFTTLDTGDWVCGPAGGMECRGADDANEFDRQQTKIVQAMCAIDADVFGLMELENANPANDPDPGDGIDNYVLKNLVEALNDAESPCPDKTYGFTDSEATGTDAIRQGIIYKTDVVTPTGRAVLTDTEFTDPNDLGEQKNRPAIAETFEDSNGEKFTVVVNHLKSKSSSCGEGDDDPDAGYCNLTRALGAEALADWLATDPTGSGDEDFLIVGDLNSYDKEDPVDVLTLEGYADLLFQYEGERAYSYVYDGQLGYLDYGMANEDLLPQVTGATAWHINADEPDILDYDTSYKKAAQDALFEENPYRASDHDPVIVGLRLSQLPYRLHLPIIARSAEG